MTQRTRTRLTVGGGTRLAVLAALTVVVVRAQGPTAFDLWLSTAVAAHRSDAVIRIMEGITLAGSFNAVVAIGAVCCVWGLARRDWSPFLFVVPVAALASLTTNGMKLLVARPRPGDDIALRAFSGYSFPSGHATTAAALWGAVAVILVRRARWPVWSAVILTASAAFLVSCSRIVLGAHWFTDVVAGTAVGVGFVAVAALLVQPPPPLRGRSTDRQRRGLRQADRPPP